MTQRRSAYARPTWIRRHVVANIQWLELASARLAARFIGDAMLQVRGRRTGRTHATLARPIAVAGQRYLVAIRGETNWARNLRTASRATLHWQGRIEEIAGVEVIGPERAEVVSEFLATSKFAATRRIMTEVLPEPEQHPVFRIFPIDGGRTS